MGTMTFLVPTDLDAEAAQELEHACVAGGPDNMPWPTRVQVEPGRLTVQRDVGESGYLVVPWSMDRRGLLMATTATLMERPEPYDLQVELARGKVNQLRCQAADWQAGGLQMPATLEDTVLKTGVLFGRAATEAQAEQAGKLARAALDTSFQAAEELTQLYISQVFQVRHQRDDRLNTLLGCRVAGAANAEQLDTLLPACNSICLPLRWSAIETTEGSYYWDQVDSVLDWAEARGIMVTAGPVIDFSSAQMPDWLWLYERDLRSLDKFMSNYLGNALRRYRKRVRRWLLTSASNSAAVLSLGEEELLWLTIKLVQVARQIDPGLELSVGLSQPWGEYMAVEERTHSPFIFADTLIRSELNLSALDVELLMGIASRGSYCRDLLDTSRMLDLYALLGVPLRVTLGLPSSSVPDPHADPELRVAAGRWRGDFCPSVQADWTAVYGALPLCKPYVQAVHWAQFSDTVTHQFPHCGLVDPSGQSRPALRQLQQLREEHLR